MSRSNPEMQIVESLLKAIDDGEDSIDNLGLSPEELDKYSGCLLVSGIVTSVQTDTEERSLLNPTAVGNALLALIRKLEDVSEQSESVSSGSTPDCEPTEKIPWYNLDAYILQQADINRIKAESIN